MKLLFCLDCHDLFRLTEDPRACACGKTRGWYVNNHEAVVNGEGVSLAIGNGALQEAVQAVLHSDPSAHNRADWQERGRITHAWARPHEGPGNPHTRVNPNL